MYFLIEKFGLFNGWLLTAAAIFIRYALFAGLAYLLFYIIKRKAFSKARIQRTYPGKPNILSEIRHSFYTAFVFALIGVGLYFLREAGYTRIYTDISTFGVSPTVVRVVTNKEGKILRTAQTAWRRFVRASTSLFSGQSKPANAKRKWARCSSAR